MKGSTKVWIYVLDCVLYFTVLTAIELAKEWGVIGAQGLRQYDKYDWMILFVGVWSVTGITIHAYFNNRFLKNENTETKTTKVDI